MSMVVSQQKYDAMCDRMRSEMNYSSLTPEQKASFDRQLDNVMKEKGVVVDPALNTGVNASDESNANAGNNTEDENQNKDDRDNGIPRGKSDDEKTNDKSDESSNEDGPSHDDDDGMSLG